MSSSSFYSGLSTSKVATLRNEYGYNELTEHHTSSIVLFLRYFWGPIPWMIEAAIAISFVTRAWQDVGILSVLLFLNAGVGFWQEYKAGNAIALLKKKLALTATALRDGEWKEIAARELVPGDVLSVHLGDIVPADATILDGAEFSLDESMLTGESLPVEKHTQDTVYSGSIIRQGTGILCVTAIGMKTYFGKTTSLVQETKTTSHFQKAIVQIGNYLILFAIALVTIIFLVSLFRHDSLLEALHFSLVLLVAAIPAALPTVLSVTLAVGAINLSRKQAIVSRLVAIEEMAGMDVLCLDKTGTLTQNTLTVRTIVPCGSHTEESVLRAAALACEQTHLDAIDTAISAARDVYASLLEEQKKMHLIEFDPFDPVEKRAVGTYKTSGGSTLHVAKGAPQSIAELVGSTKKLTNELTTVVEGAASEGFRSIAVAQKKGKGKWTLLGVISLSDPARDDSEATIKKAKAMGISLKMITGDHLAIATHIGKEVGLGTNMVSAQHFVDSGDSDATKDIEEHDGFAEVFPEHKFRIVSLLQKAKHIVGMTGDGVNDTPALVAADVGIAVEGATDAAKSVADIVFTKPGISVIVDAIEESRKIFHRMSHYAMYRIAETIRVLLFITLSVLIFHTYPVTAIMIVLLAILNDAPIMTIAYDNVKFSPAPERWNMKQLLSVASVLGVIGVLSSFFLYYIGRDFLRLSPDALQSLMYLKLSIAGHLTVFVARTKHHFWSIRPSKYLFVAVVATQIIATLLVVYGIFLPPLGWKLALGVWIYALVFFLIADVLKVQFYRLLGVLA